MSRKLARCAISKALLAACICTVFYTTSISNSIGIRLVAAESLSSSQRSLNDENKAASQTSNIIPSAGAAPLYNNNGDILASGPCESFIASYCKDAEAGEGRLVACLTKRQEEELQGNVVGRKLTPKCIQLLSDYRTDKASNINKDVPLAKACKNDVEKFCASKSDEKDPGSVAACLKEQNEELSKGCQTEIFRVKQEGLGDIRLDVPLFTVCQGDLQRVCADVEKGEGREQACLSDNRIHVSWDCQQQLFRYEEETQDDIRLSVRLFHKCLADQKKFCKDVEPGHMRMQLCLEDNMDNAEMSAGCKEELDNVLAKRVSNFRLNTRVRKNCEGDLQQICGVTLKEMDKNSTSKAIGINCLQQLKEELKDEKCKKVVHRMMSRAGRDIRFDEVLANACTEDRKKYCTDIQPGSARVIRCLADRRSDLDQKCAAALFDHETRMAEDIDFKYPMKRACAFEIKIFCKGTPRGHARVIRCLQEHLEDDDMGGECKAEVVSDMNRMASDYRLNWRLNHACGADIKQLCPSMCNNRGQPCGGLVLHCLQEKQDNITSAECQQEVFYYQLMEVSDFRNDVILAEACRKDVDSYCKDVEPGEGRVHQCLRLNKDRVSDRCRKEEMKLAAIEYRDIRLRPKLNKLCSEEKAVFCKNTKPGQARVIKCLLENMAKPSFGSECKIELETREEMMKTDYRFDAGVSTACKPYVGSLCADAASKLRGNAVVLKCLVVNFKQTDDACQTQLSRAVRLALWSYKPDVGVTSVCDADVQKWCPRGATARSSAPLTIGVVGRCLSKALVERKVLEPNCRELVLVAAPKDARAYHDASNATSSAILNQIIKLQKAAGLESVLVDTYTRSGNSVTVTGWVALACMLSLIVVFFGGLILLYRKYTGVDRPQDMHVKLGDA